MKYSALGNTGLTVSRLSFGASALGGVFRSVDESTGIEAVHAALDSGPQPGPAGKQGIMSDLRRVRVHGDQPF